VDLLAGGPICDTKNALCVECATDADCSKSSAPRCDPASHTCGQCVTNADCKDKPGGSACVEGECGCLAPSDCPGLSGCQPQLHFCNASCGSGNPCAVGVCDPVSRVCFACQSDADCAKTPGTPLCDTSAIGHACVECLQDSDCGQSPGGHTCLASAERCGCRRGSDCAPGQTCNLLKESCVPACASDADCVGSSSGALCHPVLDRCVSCIRDADCPVGIACDPQKLTCN
jgi:hypothetical protein